VSDPIPVRKSRHVKVVPYLVTPDNEVALDPQRLRAAAEAAAARERGDRDNAARHQELAGSYQALHEAYRQREEVFAATMADRAEWDAATRAQRHLAVAADAELRRRHPGQHYPPLRRRSSSCPAASIDASEIPAGSR
jgi:hypothetical protein